MLKLVQHDKMIEMTEIRKNKNKNILKAIFLLACFLAFFVGIFSEKNAEAAITKQISYQGKLTNAAGVAVADGNYSMKISIYDAATGGSCLWTARGTCGTPTARTVAVANGIFSIMLGDTVAGDNAIALTFNVPYYLGITVGTDAEMGPTRKTIGSSGYAFNSDLLDGLDSAASGATAHILATDSSGGITTVGVNSGTGLIQGTGGLTITGAAVNINASSNFAVNIATGTSTGAVTIGGNANTVYINSSDWDISTTGAMTGISGISNDGAYTQTGVSANAFTGTSTFSNATYSALFTGGNVGIGTATPAYALDVTKSVNSYLQQIYNTNTGTLAGGLYIRTDGTGNLLTLNKGGSDIVTISDTASVFNNPTSFTAAGDVSMAYDLIFTNPTASYIKSSAPLYLEAGEVFNSSDLTLRTFNSGDVVFDAAGGLTSAQAQTWNLAAGVSAMNFVNAAGTTLLNIDSTNARVGIGTASPSSLLHVNGTSRFGNILTFDGGSQITWGTVGSVSYGAILNTTSTTALGFGTNGTTPDMMIDSTGKVGIGITSPATNLDVNGSGLIRQALAVADTTVKVYSSFGTNATSHSLANNSDVLFSGNVEIDGNLYLDSSSITIPTGTVSGDLEITGILKLADGSAANPSYTFASDTDTGLFRGGTNILGMTTAGTERLRIDASGNVGIGTTSPSYILDVIGSSLSTARFTSSDAGTDGMYLRLFKNSASPAAADIVSRIEFYGKDSAANDQHYGDLIVTADDVTSGSEDSSIYFRQPVAGVTTEVMRLKNGNVGIGTASPAQTLTVGDATSEYIQSYGGFIGHPTANIGGTGDAAYFPEGIYSAKANWLYGGIVLNNGGLTLVGAISGVTTIGMSGQLTSTLATGTSPFAVTSTTVNTNLNADLLDGNHASAFALSNNSVYYIEGTGTVAGTWLGTHSEITAYYDGLTLRYYTPIAGATTTTLNIGGLGAATIYLYGTTRLTTHYPANSVITLTYSSTKNGGSWFVQPYYADGTESYTVRWNSTLQAGTAAIYDYKLVMFGAADGKVYPLTLETGTATTKTVSSVEFNPMSPILYYGSTTDIAANETSANYWYEGVRSAYLNYTANQASGFTAYTPIYIKGTITSSGNFQLAGAGTSTNPDNQAFLTQTLPTTEDGFVYILLGHTYSTTTSFRLTTSHPIYEYKGGKLRPYTSEADTLGTVVARGSTTTSAISAPTFQGNSAAVTFGNASYASTIVGSALTISPTSWTATPTISGLITGNAGLTITGAAVNLNASSNFAVNIGTGTSTGAVTIGGNANTVEVNSSDWDISTTGAMTGISGITNDGSYTQSGTSANTFTGTSTFSNVTYSALFTGGNVGIGTTSPLDKLHVSGNVRIDDQILSGQSVTLDAETATGLRVANSSGYINITPLNTSWAHITTDRARFYFDKEIRINTGYISSYDEDLTLRTSGTDRITISNTLGNVGIGTTSPNTALEVNGVIRQGVASGISIGSDAGRNRISGYASAPEIRMLNTSNIYGNFGVGSLSVGRSYAGIAAPTSGAIIEGNVGIGTTSPGELLSLGLAGTTKGVLSLSGNTSGKIIIQPADAAGTYTLTLPTDDGDASQFLTTNGSGVLSWATGGSSGANTALSNLASVAINASLLPGTNDSIDLGDDTHRWANVFLGGETLHIGTSTTDEGYLSYTTSTDVLNMQSTGNISLQPTAGNVGIGTTTPGYLLDVNGSAALGSGTEVMRITSAGNVGIGIATPSQMLQVGSSTTAGNVYIANGYLCVDNNGTCATASPVAGTVYAVNAYTTGADYAEYFYTKDEDLKSGEAVCIDTENDNAVERCQNSGDNNIMGIVSTNPSIVGNRSEKQKSDPDHYKIIGMIGQVAGLVTNENGEIKIGDSLTASATAGLMRKANAGESTVGIAMQNSNNTKDMIQVLISRRNKSLLAEEVERQIDKRIQAFGLDAKIAESIAALKIEDRINQLVSDILQTPLLFEGITTAYEEKLATLRNEMAIGMGDLAEKSSVLEEKNNDLVMLTQNQQLQIDNLSNLQLLNSQKITEKFVLLDNQLNILDNKFEIGKDNTNNIGLGLNALRDEMSAVANKLAMTKSSVAPEMKNIFSFADSSVEVSTNLENSNYDDASFGGTYANAEAYKQIAVELENGMDLSQYDMTTGTLEFEIYLQDADLFQDFNVEFGNIQDEQEMQWNKANMPWLVDGWNSVRLSIGSGYEIGQVAWQDVSHFRTFFKFKGENEVRIKNLKIEISKKSNINSGAVFALDGDTIELNSMENQNTLILALDNKASEMNTKVSNQQDLIDSIQAQVNEINSNSGILNVAQLESNTGEIGLIESILGFDRVANAGDVDIIGKLSAEKTESGQMLIKVSEEARRTIGESAIISVKVDANNDKIDDETGSDGKKVFVESLMANAKSRIFVTSKKATDQNLAVTSIVDKLGFWVEVKNQVSDDLTFDWWMVEENNVIVP